MEICVLNTKNKLETSWCMKKENKRFSLFILKNKT